MQNFREFEAGPDPFGQTWKVRFKWLQTAISIRHSNSVDVRFLLESGAENQQKTVSMSLPALVSVAAESGVPMTDAWCARLAAQHLKHLVNSGEDMEKELVYLSPKEISVYSGQVRDWEATEVRRKRGAA